jgi:DNA-binding XRE family transcriptional regulator
VITQCYFTRWHFIHPLSMVLGMQQPDKTTAQSDETPPQHGGTPHQAETSVAAAPTTVRGNQALQIAIGKRIRQRREQKGIAQETFAYEAGFNRAWYGSVERGRYNITASNLARIALALGVEVGEIFPDQAELESLLLSSPEA